MTDASWDNTTCRVFRREMEAPGEGTDTAAAMGGIGIAGEINVGKK